MFKYVLAFLVFMVVLSAIAVPIYIIIDSRKRPLIQDLSLTEKDFARYKKLIKQNCSAAAFRSYYNFLKKYPGGYYKKKKDGTVIGREYSGREKGDLKGIFFNVVFPNPHLRIEDKEEFRMFLISKGVNGCYARPEYETRDGKLTNKKADEEEFEKKEVGNLGEEAVRNKLNSLKDKGYLIINGAVLKYDDKKVEYDHIVIGQNGVFSLETKSYGLSKDGKNRASLFIDEGDKWVLRKYKKNRELKSPTTQILKERDHLKDLLHNAKEKIEVKPILVLSNKDLFLKNNIELEYDVVTVNDLEDCIVNSQLNRISHDEEILIAQIIDDHRINA